MNLVAVALNCIGDEYLHNISYANIIDMNRHIDTFKSTDTLINTLNNLQNKYDYALIVREGTYLRPELILDFIKNSIKDKPDIIAFKNLNSYCFVVNLKINWYVHDTDTFIKDFPINAKIKYFTKEIEKDTFVRTDADWQSEHDYNLNLDKIYEENTEPLYRECTKQKYEDFYSYDKTLYLLCSGTKPFRTLVEYYRNNVTPQLVVFYDISKSSVEYYKELYRSKELLLNQLPKSIDQQDFWDWFESFNIEFMNKDIIDDYKWIRPGSSIWRSNVFSYLPTRIKYGVESVENRRIAFEKYCKDNKILVWKYLPRLKDPA